MSIISQVSFTENVAIVTFEKAHAHIKFMSVMFDRVAKAGINVDMISQNAPKGEYSTISFTVSDEYVTAILAIIAELKAEHKSLTPLISSGNVKISLYGAEMPNNFGVAADVFMKLDEKHIDTMLITTSDVDISLVVSSANADMAYHLLQTAYLKN